MQHLRRRARPIHLKARRRWESRSNNHHTPLLSRGGESRRGSGGWGGAGQQNRSLDHPSSRAEVASQLFICRAATPPRLRRGVSSQSPLLCKALRNRKKETVEYGIL